MTKHHTKMRTLLVFCLSLIHLTFSCPPECNSCVGNTANCQNSGLRDIPKHFPKDLATIDLTDNQLTELGEGSFPNLPTIQSLKLSRNGINHVKGKSFESMQNLMSLDLSGNPITLIDDDAFKGLSKLRTLSLTSVDIRRIGTPFKETPAVSSLNLGYNKISELEDDDFENNMYIRVLDLSNNKITSIQSKTFKNLKMLRYLIIKNNPIAEVDNLQFSSTMLHLVDFTNCQLIKVPTTMPASVADFRLGNNAIKQVTVSDFQNITNLHLVTLNNNNIKKVEFKSFLENKNLKELWLSHNQLTFIPRGLPSNIVKLYMDYNKVYMMEAKLFDPESKLELISLEMNEVMTIMPNSLQGLKYLSDVNLRGNAIKEIQSLTFSNLTNLHMLTLSNNPLEKIGKNAFKDLPKLKKLAMSYLASDSFELGPDFLEGIKNTDNLQILNSPSFASRLLSIAASLDAPILAGVREVNMQYNDLKTIAENVKNVLQNVQKFYLDGNIWHCDKRLMWLRDWLKASSHISFFMNDAPSCETPAALQGQELWSLKDSDFVEVAPKSSSKKSDFLNAVVAKVTDSKVVSTSVSPNAVGKLKLTTPAPTKKTKRKKGKGKKGKKNKNKKNKKRKNKKGKKRRNKKRSKGKKGRGKRKINGSKVRRKCTPQPDGTRKCCRTLKNGQERCRIRKKKRTKKNKTTPAPKII